MRANVELEMNAGERSALKTLTAEEREAVVDELVAQAREELEWALARAAVVELVTAPPSTRPATPPPLPAAAGGPATRRSKPIRRPPPRSWINR